MDFCGGRNNVSKLFNYSLAGWVLMGLSLAPAMSGAQAGPTERKLIDTGSAVTGAEDDAPRPRRLGDSLSVDDAQEWRPGFTPRSDSGLSLLEEKIAQAQTALARGNIMAPGQGALDLFRKVLALDPGNLSAQKGIADAVQQLADKLRRAYVQADDVATDQLMADLRLVDPDHPALIEVGQLQEIDLQLEELLSSARAAVQEQQWLGPEGAEGYYRQMLDLNPQNSQATAGLAAIEQALIEQAVALTRDEQFASATEILRNAHLLRGDPDEAVVAQQVSVDGAQRAFFNARVKRAAGFIEQGKFDLADFALTELRNSGFSGSLDGLEADIALGRMVLAYDPGSRLNDGAFAGAPEMIVVPAGSFQMGSPDTEAGRSAREGPRKEITLTVPFAMSSTEVTVAQFRQFVEATGYLTDAEKSGRSQIFDERQGSSVEQVGVDWSMDFRGRKAKPDMPVVHVSWHDAAAYAAWLSQVSGESYRLPSESEFEYALRAGSNSAYWWGDGAPPKMVENLTGERDRLEDLRWPVAFERYGDGHWGPAAVASFSANPFKLHDLGGNASEWVNDCYRGDLSTQPSVQPADCERRVIRGASWASQPEQARSAYRGAADPARASCLVGFRVVRELWSGRLSASF